MRYFIYTLITIAIGLLLFNSSKLDFDNLLNGDSKTALITITACACVIILLLILLVSRTILEKSKKTSYKRL